MLLVSRTNHAVGVCASIGFGAGRELYDLNSIFPDSAIIGIEASEQMIKMSQAMLSNVKTQSRRIKSFQSKSLTRISLLFGDAQNLPVPSGSLDFVVCVNVIDRVSSCAKVLDELMRVVTSEGFILLVSADDYANSPAPLHEHLSYKQIREKLVYNDFKCIIEEQFSLGKEVNGTLSRFDEWAIIMQRLR